MINVKEHFYDDDPSKGHPDCRTRLKDAYYFFLGNGLISAAVQVSLSGEGSPIGLLLMDPDKLGKKRDALSFDPESGLENTMVQVRFNGDQCDSPCGSRITAHWNEESLIPEVLLTWTTSKIEVVERFFCPDLDSSSLARAIKIKIRLNKKRFKNIMVRTGLLGFKTEIFFDVSMRKTQELFFIYELNKEEGRISIKNVPSVHIDPLVSEYWRKKTQAQFGHQLLNHYFISSRNQLPAVISRSGKADASIWQYNREWVRDHSMMVLGLLLTGHHEKARILLERLIKDFVTPEGDTVDSSERRNPDEIELDQNGELLWMLWNYILWTNDRSLAEKYWSRIEKIAEFPLKDIFRHTPSGLLMNRRDYWERHRIHGIEAGMELTYQFFVSIGLEAVATIARVLGKNSQAERWKKEANGLKQAMLSDRKYGLVESGVFIKRRGPDGRTQEKIKPLPSAGLPPGLPLTTPGDHFLNPDTSAILPIAMNFISPDSEIAKKTLKSCEELWSQAWDGGGYGRYHFSSEADSAGPWPFPSLFMARAWAEAGNQKKVIRILEWLNEVPGALSGAWFEFYGDRLSPPYPQVGVPPWTWTEMLMLLINHLIGLRLFEDHINIRPIFLPGITCMQIRLLIRDHHLSLKLEKRKAADQKRFQTDGKILRSTQQDVDLVYPEHDIRLHAFF